MRALLIVTGVLGLGTGVVFAAALVVAMLFPNGSLLMGQGATFASDVVMAKGGVILGGPIQVTRIPSGGTSIAVAPAPVSNNPAPADGSTPSMPEASPGG